MNEYQRQRAELISLKLILGPLPYGMDPAAARGHHAAAAPKLKKAREEYLAAHGAEAIKKRFNRTWHEVWPQLGQ